MLSSSENMMDAVPFLQLTECLDQCRNNDSCNSVNYETGLCVLFSQTADKLPGMELKFFTNYVKLNTDLNERFFFSFRMIRAAIAPQTMNTLITRYDCKRIIIE